MNKLRYFFLPALSLFFLSAAAQYPTINKLLYGVAYYDEYMPYERLHKE